LKVDRVDLRSKADYIGLAKMSKQATLRSFFKASPASGMASMATKASTTTTPKGTKRSQTASELEVGKENSKNSAQSNAAEKEIPAAKKQASEKAVKESQKPAGQGPELRLEPGWKAHLEGERSKTYWKTLFSFLSAEERKGAKIYPPKEMVFSALDLCPFDKVKVVILGQDPYHGAGQAHGLAFSVQEGIKIPPSLRNIYKEAVSDVKITMPKTGCLVPWAKQGVLLLNTVLTVKEATANSHQKKGWENFTDEIIRVLNKEKKGLVFMLWGNSAQQKAASVNRSKHLVITSSHPSPLGAAKTKEPFLGSKCFSRANTYLIEQGLEPIDWKI